jgi:membrane protein implicated in regulation of membrane protease activity
MPLDRLVLIIVCVLGAAAATVYVGAAVIASTQMPPFMGMAVLSIIALCAYVGWRVIAERLHNKDDDHYDKFEN